MRSAWRLAARLPLPAAPAAGTRGARAEEVAAYAQRVREVRQRYAAELASQPTRAQQAAARKAEHAQRSSQEWHAYLEKLQAALADPNSAIRRDRHPCRPVVQHTKSAEARERAAQSVSRVLAQQQLVRRKYVAVLGKEAGVEGAAPIITAESLDARIEHAVRHPTSYNMSGERMVERVLQVREALQAVKVPVDRTLFVCGAAQRDVKET